MKYLSIDIETTGLDYRYDQMIEIAMILDDTSKPEVPLNDLPTFHSFVKHYRYTGDAVALSMNARILKQLGDPAIPKTRIDELAKRMHDWMLIHLEWLSAQVTVAGKNFTSFDLNFISKLSDYSLNSGPRVQRTGSFLTIGQFTFGKCLDPGTLLWNPLTDDKPPSTNECLKRIGVNKETAHTAIDDAQDVIRMIRYHVSHYKEVVA